MITAKTQTELGELSLAFTCGTHVSVTGRVTVRGVIYRVHFHFMPKNGQWVESERRYISGMYDQNQKFWGKTPPKTVENKIVETITRAVLAFVANNPDTLSAAEANAIDSDIYAVKSKIDSLTAELEQYRARLRELEERKNNLDLVLSKTLNI